MSLNSRNHLLSRTKFHLSAADRVYSAAVVLALGSCAPRGLQDRLRSGQEADMRPAEAKELVLGLMLGGGLAPLSACGPSMRQLEPVLGRHQVWL